MFSLPTIFCAPLFTCSVSDTEVIQGTRRYFEFALLCSIDTVEWNAFWKWSRQLYSQTTVRLCHAVVWPRGLATQLPGCVIKQRFVWTLPSMFHFALCHPSYSRNVVTAGRTRRTRSVRRTSGRAFWSPRTRSDTSIRPTPLRTWRWVFQDSSCSGLERTKWRESVSRLSSKVTWLPVFGVHPVIGLKRSPGWKKAFENAKRANASKSVYYQFIHLGWLSQFFQC